MTTEEFLTISLVDTVPLAISTISPKRNIGHNHVDSTSGLNKQKPFGILLLRYCVEPNDGKEMVFLIKTVKFSVP